MTDRGGAGVGSLPCGNGLEHQAEKSLCSLATADYSFKTAGLSLVFRNQWRGLEIALFPVF